MTSPNIGVRADGPFSERPCNHCSFETALRLMMEASWG
jgi:hypothetical protein